MEIDAALERRGRGPRWKVDRNRLVPKGLRMRCGAFDSWELGFGVERDGLVAIGEGGRGCDGDGEQEEVV